MIFSIVAMHCYRQQRSRCRDVLKRIKVCTSFAFDRATGFRDRIASKPPVLCEQFRSSNDRLFEPLKLAALPMFQIGSL